MRRPYFLASDTHICLHGGKAVLLDLTSGKYFGFDKDDASELSAWVVGWPVKAANEKYSDYRAEETEPELLRDLCARALLTPDPDRGKSATPIHIAVASVSLRDIQPTDPRITTQLICRFLFAVTFSGIALRLLPLSTIVAYIRRQKTRGRTHSPNMKKITELVAAFSRMRPFMLRATNNCLCHSLALFQFLSAYDEYPEWVFGVRSEPFFAHCWLQQGTWLLSDSPAAVASLTPVLAI